MSAWALAAAVAIGVVALVLWLRGPMVYRGVGRRDLSQYLETLFLNSRPGSKMTISAESAIEEIVFTKLGSLEGQIAGSAEMAGLVQSREIFERLAAGIRAEEEGGSCVALANGVQFVSPRPHVLRQGFRIADTLLNELHIAPESKLQISFRARMDPSSLRPAFEALERYPANSVLGAFGRRGLHLLDRRTRKVSSGPDHDDSQSGRRNNP